MKFWLQILGVAFLGLFLTACSSGGADSTTPEPPALAFLDVTCIPDRVLADGASESLIRVMATDQAGGPVSDRIVFFKIIDGQGALVESAATTDEYGLAEISFLASTEPGVTTIKIWSEGVETYAYVSTVSELITPASLGIAAEPAVLALRGESTIRCAVFDTYGRALVGSIVYFDIIDGGGALSAGAEVTGEDGLAEVTFTAPSYQDEVTIRGRVMRGDEPTPVYIYNTVNLWVRNSVPDVSGIDLSANPDIIYTEETSELRVFVYDATNKGIENVEVFFAIDEDDHGGLSALTAVTNENGEASVTFTATTRTGYVDVYAYAGNKSDSDRIRVDTKPDVNSTSILLTKNWNMQEIFFN